MTYMSADDVAFALLRTRTQVKVFHWQTTLYAEHKALDKLDGALIALNDKWVESYQGSEDRRVVLGDNKRLFNLEEWRPGQAYNFIKRQLEYFRSVRGYQVEYLANIMDEIDAALSQTLFLLTLD